MNREKRAMSKEKGAMSNKQRVMLKIGIHANFQLRSFFSEKTPAKALEPAASMPPKATRYVLAFFFVICYLLFGTSPLFSQTADRLEKLLQQEHVSYKDTALLVLEASGHIDAKKQTSADDAFNIAIQRGWLPKNTAANNATRLNGLSLLVMRAFDINGGAFFSLFKNPHYAYRAMVYRGIIQGRSDPQMLVSGDLLLYTVNRAMEREQRAGRKEE
jgi:hypothetical protein